MRELWYRGKVQFCVRHRDISYLKNNSAFNAEYISTDPIIWRPFTSSSSQYDQQYANTCTINCTHTTRVAKGTLTVSVKQLRYLAKNYELKKACPNISDQLKINNLGDYAWRWKYRPDIPIILTEDFYFSKEQNKLAIKPVSVYTVITAQIKIYTSYTVYLFIYSE